MESLLLEMIDRDAQTRYPVVDYRLKQQSSYNRVSVSPEDSVGWFANHDFNSNDKDRNFVRIDTINGQKEWVLMEHNGPGAIVRTWMPLKPKIITVIRGVESAPIFMNIRFMLNKGHMFITN